MKSWCHSLAFIERCVNLPNIANGNITYQRNQLQVMYKCDEDYTLVGRMLRRCINGGWNWTQPSCLNKLCIVRHLVMGKNVKSK